MRPSTRLSSRSSRPIDCSSCARVLSSSPLSKVSQRSGSSGAGGTSHHGVYRSLASMRLRVRSIRRSRCSSITSGPRRIATRRGRRGRSHRGRHTLGNGHGRINLRIVDGAEHFMMPVPAAHPPPRPGLPGQCDNPSAAGHANAPILSPSAPGPSVLGPMLPRCNMTRFRNRHAPN